MRGAERSARNTAKNISLIVLVVLMAVLCAANWLAGVSAASLDSDTLLRRAHDRLFGGAAGYEIRSSGVSAASPAQLALGAEGKLVGVQYNVTDMDTSLAAVRAIWTQALSGGALEETDEQTLADALIAERTVLLRYHGAIPFSVVSGWMGGTLKNDNISVETLFYSADSGELFVRTPEGTLYRSHAEADRGTFDRALEDFHGLDCTFAGAGGNVYPETLLFANENLTLPLLKTEALDLFDAQGGTGLASLLGAFGLSAYTDFYSEQSDAVRVFVDDASTLRLAKTGRMQYTTTGDQSTVTAYESGEVTGAAAIDAQIDCARTLLDTVLRAAQTDTHASLYAVRKDGSRTTLVFLQLYGGVPVLESTDFASFTFEGGVLRAATVNLQRFAATGESRTLLPAEQAAAAASPDERSMMAAYRTENGVYAPAGLDADLRTLVSGYGSALSEDFRLPDDVFLPELSLDRSRSDEENTASVMLGADMERSETEDGTVRFSSADGTVTWYADGRVNGVCPMIGETPENEADAVRTARKCLSEWGLSAEGATVSVMGLTVTQTAPVAGRPVHNRELTLTMNEDGTVTVSGTWSFGTPYTTVTGRGVECRAADALLQFASSLQKGETVLSMTAGYRMQMDSSRRMQLIPTWKIVTDRTQYLVDGDKKTVVT